MDQCVIGKEPLDNGQQTVVLREKGSNGVNKASELRGDCIRTSAGQTVHQACRRDYCNTNVISRDIKGKTKETSIPSRRLRSQETSFQFSEHCIFCSQPAKCSGKKRGSGVFPVRTADFQTSIENACKERGDTWAQTVHSRIEFAQDLHAADAVYHQVCSINFRTGKQIPLEYQVIQQGKKPRLGRPIDTSKEKTFLEVAEYLIENDDEQITISDLVQKMREFSNQDTDAYSVRHMKSKLDEHFGNNIVITSINGKADVATFRSTASNILRSFYEAPKLTDPEAEKKRIVKAAADFIKNDIKCRQTSKKFYPTPSDISSLEKNSAFVPETLRLLLGTIFSEKKTELKIASIGQTIVQAARPRVLIAPLQIGLAVQMHHHFGSKFIVDSLNRHGFCSSYSEVKRFEMCAAKTQGTEIPGFTPGHFVQYVADNADHNIRTLDGQDTFHGMGIIAAVTPGTKRQIPVPRCSARATDVADVGKIAVHFYKGTCGASLSLVYKKIQVLQQNDPTWKLDLLWKVVWPIRSPRPGWSGIMQAVSQGTHPGKSSVTFLPMIDMNASDMSCVYSTLRFVVTECSAIKWSLSSLLTNLCDGRPS